MKTEDYGLLNGFSNIIVIGGTDSNYLGRMLRMKAYAVSLIEDGRIWVIKTKLDIPSKK